MASIRSMLEERENSFLAPFAARSVESRGREHPIGADDLRTEYQRDRDRILHCDAFRRLMHKTQCFLSSGDAHFRTRLTHTVEVSQIARMLARSLCLNEDLTEAIALGHDLGHTPFGHMGERTLDRLMREGFQHREQSLRVVEHLERNGEGLNLTWEVRDGILHHSGPTPAATLEGQCVSRADRIAYINHDIDDALRAGVLKPKQLPAGLLKVLGTTRGERIDTMIRDIISVSADGESIRMSPAIAEATMELRAFLFEKVYMRPEAIREEEKSDRLLEALFRHALSHPEIMPDDYIVRGYREGLERTCCDFIASMTDSHARRACSQLFMPSEA